MAARAVAGRTPEGGNAAVTALAGVGPALASALARLGVERVQDLWFHLPLRYEDRTRITPIAAARPGMRVQVEGAIEAVEAGFRFRRQLQVAISDDSRGTMVLRFFHYHRSMSERLRPGQRLRCYGEARWGMHGPEMVHPTWQVVRPGAPLEQRLTPVYPTTEGLGQKRLATLIDKALACLPPAAELELLPAALLEPLQLSGLREALECVHRPPAGADLAALAEGRHPAQRRLAFEELLVNHLALKMLRRRVRRHHAPPLQGDGKLREALRGRLPFALTAAQQRVAAEIEADLGRPKPMLRLVQGDVGSGKTVVAALSALVAIESGRQAALVAPTELLAEQHLQTFRGWLEPLGVEVQWLAGKVLGKARQQALGRIAGGAQMVIGTHALMQEGVAFRDLALVIVDEQHRFGVEQRLALSEKGGRAASVPHQLVMTATPIPRTLAMSAYADLDVSSIDALPPGRTPVGTVAVSSARREEIIERIRAACAEGQQAYWVCTLIEESEMLDAQPAERASEELAAALPVEVGLLHGRMKPAEKRAVMDRFAAGEIAVLVATTVVEVGVDVPNASLMVIENAERLGLAQLHQLRGRVGRGRRASHCVLLYHPPLSALARQRLEAMRETNDGFRIAEQDLALRGPGEVLGTRQTGEAAFRVADLLRDADLLPAVQRVGAVLLKEQPAVAERLVRRWLGAAARYARA
ncbi:MAG TPA: ATP-dependent DNA helicase RecG [Rhodanobacteraceae bacterium]|nr:ATP-dependent DNA helicase RecG [Rhodanobacteraceae bacterium]